MLAMLAMLLATRPAAVRAQESEAEEPDLWRVLLDIAYSGSSGNQNLSFLDAGMGVTRLETDIAEFELTARGRSGTDDGVRVAESYMASLRADAFPLERWSPFVFASAERDRFKQLDLRTNAGGGIKYTFLREEDTEVSISLAALHNREDFRIPDEPTLTDGRLSWRFKGDHELREGVRVQNVSFYQPVWDGFDDYTIQSESRLAVQVFSMLAVSASYVYQRDSTPPTDVLPDDHHVKLGVQLQL
jgi:putative salt-induced outer membrane protein YdiY